MWWASAALAGSLAGMSLPSIGGGFAGPSELGARGVIQQPAAAGRGEAPELLIDVGLIATRYAHHLDTFDATQVNPGLSVQPSLMLAIPFAKRFGIGAAVQSSWLRSTRYPADGPQRLYIVESDVSMYELDLVGSARVTDWLTVGAGARIGMASYRNFKGLNMAASLNHSLDIDPPLPVEDEIFIGTQEIGPMRKFTGSFILGAAFNYEWVQVDLAFRPQWKAKFEGPIAVTPSTTLNAELRGDMELDLNFPAMVSLSARLTPDEQWTVLPMVEWVGWKWAGRNRAEVKNMALTSPDPTFDALLQEAGVSQNDFVRSLEGPSNADLGWRDVINASVDVAYKIRPEISLRGGIGYAPSAIPMDDTTPSNVDFGVFTFKAGGSWRLAEPIQVGLMFERYQGFTRRVTGSPLSLKDPQPGNPILPNSNGTYSFGLWRAGLTLQAFLPEIRKKS